MIRKSMIRFGAALLPLVAAAQVSVAQTAASAQLPTAASLVAKYAAAVGGPAYLSAKSIVTKGGMSMPAAGLEATFEMTNLAPDKMLMVTNIPGMGEVQVGFDGTTAWAMDPMQGPRVLAGKEMDQMKDEADRRASVRSPEMFTAMQTVADTTMNSERCFLVKLTWKSGRETYDCYSAATGLAVASKSTQKTAMGEIPVTILMSDYKKFGDVMVATKTVNELMGQQQILTISSVEFGTGAGMKIEPPAAVKALPKPASK
ncbi:MAG: hypothetical protein ABIS03_10425 [Gemmatimonadaceae bacterium]